VESPALIVTVLVESHSPRSRRPPARPTLAACSSAWAASNTSDSIKMPTAAAVHLALCIVRIW